MIKPEDLELGTKMYQWVKDLMPINRSLTGEGVRQTLQYLKEINPDLTIKAVPTGKKVYDWTIPNEWKINDAYIADLDGNRVISFSESNLHVVGYSTSIDCMLSREELEPHLYSIKEQPNAIPYVTSYYKENWGFCLTQNQRDGLGHGPFRVVIDSRLHEGVMNYGELLIQGESKEEILFTTYICHPSMANNELSGPALLTALAQLIQKIPNRRYSYRFLFTVETIGSIYFINSCLARLKKYLLAGWVVTCVGDDRAFSYVPSRNGNSLADRVSLIALRDRVEKYHSYSWLERGSDERQYCAPGVDLPVASVMRSKYDTYPEYHTSLDDLTVVSPEGLAGAYDIYRYIVDILESNYKPNSVNLCEPQLGKRNLYPNTSTKETFEIVQNLMNVISFADGRNDVISISEMCQLSYSETLAIILKLGEAGIVTRSEKH
jgi:aminopeptidase-like protein